MGNYTSSLPSGVTGFGVWCSWQDGSNGKTGVQLHIGFKNSSGTDQSIDVVPEYHVAGQAHGDCIGSDQTIDVPAGQSVEEFIEAGAPQGVAYQTPLDSCDPHQL